LLHDLFKWLEEDLGKSSPDGLSWSQAMHGSLNLWNITEGTHVMTLMFFAGTIWIIDLRMMGLAFRNMSFSRLNDRVLPLTIAAFAVMVITGVLTFFGRTPIAYYHDVWFRLKMIFLLVASLNIFWFHYKVQKSQAEWDAMSSPPFKVKLAGAISMGSWFLVLVFGRFIAYDWYHCEKIEKGSLIYALEECKSALSYMEIAPSEAPPADAPPVVEPSPTTDDPQAPAPAPAPAEPAKPAPGKGG
jgi:hypothetical protein